MQVNLKRQISELKNISLQTVLFEAVVNSIQAGATKISLDFDLAKELIEGNTDSSVNSVKITDNGVGFTAENISSFCVLGSDYKLNRGCKGFGRLTYLCVFNKIHIESQLKDRTISCDFNLDFKASDFKEEVADNTNKYNITTLNFTDIKAKYARINLEKFRQNLIYHLTPMVYLDNNLDFTIIIENNITETLQISSGDIIRDLNFKTQEFTIKEGETPYAFTLHYSFVPNDKKGEIVSYYCANNRTVLPFKAKICPTPLPNYKLFFFLTSKYFDDRVNNERNDFDISKKSSEKLFINWDKINRCLQEQISTILYTEFPELEEKDKEIFRKLKYDNPHLVEYLDKYGYINASNNEDELFKLAQKDYSNEKFELNKFKEDDPLGQQTIEKSKKLAAQELKEYILTRDNIIQGLASYSNNKEKLEKNIHNLFMTKYSKGDTLSPVSIKDNNLWIIDDKFMSYNYAASEKRITTLLKDTNNEVVTKEKLRFDIALYSESIGQKRVVLIELKKFSANYKENGEGVNQLTLYASYLSESGINEVYCYLIAKLDDNYRRIITSTGFSKIFSQEGEIYQRAITGMTSYIQIISPEALVADALARNKTFLDIIRKNLP